MRLALVFCGVLIGLAVGSYVGCEYGRFRALHSESERRFEEDRRLVAPILAADPAFRRIVTVSFPVAGLCLAGPVDSQDDLHRLRAEMLRLFGEPRVGHVMQDVVVEKAAEQLFGP